MPYRVLARDTQNDEPDAPRYALFSELLLGPSHGNTVARDPCHCLPRRRSAFSLVSLHTTTISACIPRVWTVSRSSIGNCPRTLQREAVYLSPQGVGFRPVQHRPRPKGQRRRRAEWRQAQRHRVETRQVASFLPSLFRIPHSAIRIRFDRSLRSRYNVRVEQGRSM